MEKDEKKDTDKIQTDTEKVQADTEKIQTDTEKIPTVTEEIAALNQYMVDTQQRIALYKFLTSRNSEELSKLEIVLKEKHGIEIEKNSKQGDDWKRVKLLGKILEKTEDKDIVLVLDSRNIPQEQLCNIYMDKLCKEAGLPPDLLYDKPPEIPSLTNYRDNLKVNGSLKKSLAGNYKMDASPRGTCLIINNTFQTKKQCEERNGKNNERGEQDEMKEKEKGSNEECEERMGTNKDKEKLEKLFKWLKFEVVVETDMAANKIVDYFCNLKKNIITPSDCFVCCILTHGNTSNIYGNDNKPIERRRLKEFVSAESCPILKGKPKLFLIQACRVREDPKVCKDARPPKQDDWGDNSVGDIYIAESTPEDYASYRYPDKGSPFIQTLCRVFEAHAHKESLNEMMLKVNQDVRKMRIKEGGKTVAPLPDSSMNTMKHNLYFSPETTYHAFCKKRPNK